MGTAWIWMNSHCNWGDILGDKSTSNLFQCYTIEGVIEFTCIWALHICDDMYTCYCYSNKLLLAFFQSNCYAEVWKLPELFAWVIIAEQSFCKNLIEYLLLKSVIAVGVSTLIVASEQFIQVYIRGASEAFLKMVRLWSCVSNYAASSLRGFLVACPPRNFFK